MEKQKCVNDIQNAIKNAQKCGFKVVVASDPEGNSYNVLNPDNLLYGFEKDGYIALAVWDGVDESEIFKNLCLGAGCEKEIPEGESVCKECGLLPGNAWLLD